MPPGGHLRPLGGGFLITVAAHKCGLHQNKMINWIVRINFASAHKCGLHLQQHGGVHQQQTLPQRTNADCIGDSCRAK